MYLTEIFRIKFVAVVLVLGVSSASAQAYDCVQLEKDEHVIAAKHYREALKVAQSKEAVAFPALAHEIFEGIPARLQAAGTEYVASNLSFIAINSIRSTLKDQDMALWSGPAGETYSDKLLREARRTKIVQAEKELNRPYVEGDRRFEAAKTEVNARGEEFASGVLLNNSSTLYFDRAFAWDDRAFELRLCMAPRRGLMLDWRFCAIYNFATQKIEYGLHLFASYRNKDPVQSDQITLYSLGESDPAAAVRTKKGQEALAAAVLEDRMLGLRSECRK